MEYTVTAFNGDSIQIDGENWMAAMGKALAFFGIDLSEIERFTCSSSHDGAVFVEEPSGGRSWMVRPQLAGPQQIERAEPAGGAGGAGLQLAAIASANTLPDPIAGWPAQDRTPCWEDHLFELNMDLATAERDESCHLALDVVLAHVPAQGGGIACASGGVLAFVAARGPAAPQLLHRRVGPGEGLVGLCFDMQRTLLVQDAATDPHTGDLDRRAGLEPRAVLCVPILGVAGRRLGVLQLVEPTEIVFTEVHVAAAEQVSASLARALDRW
ncbi:MAG TPA: GAF domain-containing protein [Deltaproteobacteria bacterium]|nr:GAF domain-containing protein [Deltaproteobacteria bacterium]